MSLPVAPTSSSFSSIQAFQAYFRDHDELFVPANQPLEIQNISILTEQEDSPFEAKETLPQELSQLALYILSKMVMPLAKTLKINLTEGGELGVNINEHFSLSFSKGMTVKTEKGTLYVRLTDLFKSMVTSSISKVEFAPRQDLVVLVITEAESQPESTFISTIPKIFEPRIPAGFDISFKFEGGNSAMLALDNAIFSPRRGLLIKSFYGWALTLHESKDFVYSIEGFLRRMKIKSEWKIPANQVLRIKDELFRRLHEEYFSTQFAADNFGEFCLNQIVLPLGKTIKIKTHGTQGCTLEWGEDFLEISSPDGLTLETGYGDLCTTLLHLGDLLISNHLSAVVLQPKQRLFIHGLTKAQWTELQKWIKSKEITTILEGLETLFMPYNPVGFVWNLSFTNHIHVAPATFTKSESAYGLMIYSNERMRLELNRASGESLALNLINESSPALLQGILDFDENAFIYILFRAIFYHCCQDFRHFRNDELPEFFKKSTQDTLQDLLKSGADFTESIRLVLENVEMHQQLLTILYSSPEKFSQLNFEKFPAPLKTLMNTLMKVVYEELRGSPFIAQCVRSIAEGLADGSLKGFIRPPASENSSSQSTSEQSAAPVVIEMQAPVTAPAVAPSVNPPQTTSEPSGTPVVSEIQTPVTAPAAAPSVNPPQTTSKQSATPVVSEMRAPETSPVATASVNPPQMATPQPTLPNSNTFSTFVSFFWSMFSGIARWINWFLGKN